ARLSDAERWLNAPPGDPSSGAGGAVSTSDRPGGAAPIRMVVADPEELPSLPGTIALARSFRAQALGDVSGTVEQARRALNLLPKDDHVWRGGSALLLALAQWVNGDLQPAERTHAEGIASLEKAGAIALAMNAAYDGANLA